jgi:integrase
MPEKLTQDAVRRLTRTPPAATRDVYDTKQPGLVLRLRPSGSHTWRALLGRGRWHTLGSLDDVELEEARELARGVRGDVSKARALGQADPIAARRRAKKTPTFERFLEDTLAPWLLEHRRAGAQTLDAARALLVPAFGRTKLNQVTPFAVEQWRTRRLRDDEVSASTVNRNVDDLKAMLSKAAAWRLIPASPIAGVKRLRVDRVGVIRFLNPDEERRLLVALDARDDRQRRAREQANAWRRERGHQEWPALGTYSDHLHPFVLTALHTGIRRGEAFGLTWGDLDLARATLTIRGETSKSGQSRVIPLNAIVLEALKTWRGQQLEVAPADLVFTSHATGEALTTVKTGWSAVLKAAKIADFRLHDCRHHFASMLVMRGVDVVTVSRLLGHGDVRMTMRYSHLAPDHLAGAVAKLVTR